MQVTHLARAGQHCIHVAARPPLPALSTPASSSSHHRRARLADLQARAETAEAAKIELSLKARGCASPSAWGLVRAERWPAWMLRLRWQTCVPSAAC